jgi:hypothetical protein
MRKTMKIAAGAAGLLLAGGAVAAAVETPDAANSGLTTAGGKSGFTVPVGQDGDHPTGDQGIAAEGAAEGTHGADVVVVAQDDSTEGRAHGTAVAGVASEGRAGGEAPEAAGEAVVETPNSGGTSTADEASDGASEAGTGHAADQAGLGAGNAGDHGQP